MLFILVAVVSIFLVDQLLFQNKEMFNELAKRMKGLSVNKKMFSKKKKSSHSVQVIVTTILKFFIKIDF